MKHPRIYLSAHSGRRVELLAAAADCSRAGLGVASSWLYAAPVHFDDDAAAAATVALADLAELSAAAALVCFVEPVSATAQGRGGRHVELGYALARGIPVVLVGEAEHVFHLHPAVHRVEGWKDALDYLLALLGTSAMPREEGS